MASPGSYANARFPSVPAALGHYESFYLKAADPRAPRGVWLRYTVLKRPGAAPRGSLWCTLWMGDEAPLAYKVTFAPADVSTPPGMLIAVGGAASFSASSARGVTDGASWELEFTRGAPEFPYLPLAALYATPIPRTKAVSLDPRATFSGQMTIGERTLQLDGWPGMVGHNWGSEHAERWIWLHGTGFAEAPDAWFDATIARIRIARWTSPWIANGGLWLDGRLHRLGGPGKIRATEVDEQPNRCRFSLKGDGVRLRGEATAPTGAVVGWRYSDPSGGEHLTANCSVCAMRLELTRSTSAPRVLTVPAGVAYELGAREAPAGVTIQPFPDP